ncbi:uncharacterized protein L203_103597 [Cryptococcus depauperatus CBS 7841]|uniref:Probable 26S proteasome regulatory subunit p27 n=1 Tax=Cryptococcus depauperatus CBS 7841 TaxID=1295531 RepID=A0A1E3IHW4_9TREE|nr:26S proteasome non-ATPase regulatory subunit 9 [Cryptococcus depauperatus CBS 7841]
MAFPPPEEPSILLLPLPHPDAYEEEPREYARALMQRRDEIEKEIDVLNDVLSSHGATASTPLVDNEGFPRADLDIYAIRHARSSLVRLRNDRQTVTDLLASALHNAFASSSGIPDNQTQSNGSYSTFIKPQANGDSAVLRPLPSTLSAEAWPERAVAKVNSVTEGSPAAQAGLKAQDIIYSFADVTYTSPGGIRDIGDIVSRSEGIALSVLVLRAQERICLTLTPRSNWDGRGTLGCHILPL